MKKRKEKNKEKTNNRIYKNILISALVVSVILAGFMFPVMILEKNGSDIIGEVKAAPEEYYMNSASAASRNMSSAKLGEYHNMKLITQVWDSITTDADASEMSDTESDIIKKAKEKLSLYYYKKLYPINVLENEGYYSYRAYPLKAIDTAFESYAAYFWLVEFQKKDGSETGCIVLTDEGSFLMADYNTTTANKFKAKLSSFNADALFENYDHIDFQTAAENGADIQMFTWFTELGNLPVQGYAEASIYKSREYIRVTINNVDYSEDNVADIEVISGPVDADSGVFVQEREFNSFKILAAGNTQRYFIGILPDA